MANGKCETLQDGVTCVFFASLLDCETETSKGFEGEREMFTLKLRALDLVESYENELE